MNQLKKILPYFIPFLIIIALGLMKMGIQSKIHPGASIYEINCSRCHGASGQGLKNLYPGILEMPLTLNNVSEWVCYIKYGINANGIQGKMLMPANEKLNESELRDLLNYIGTLKGEVKDFSIKNIRDAKEKCLELK